MDIYSVRLLVIGYFYPTEIGTFCPTQNGRFCPTLTPGRPKKNKEEGAQKETDANKYKRLRDKMAQAVEKRIEGLHNMKVQPEGN